MERSTSAGLPGPERLFPAQQRKALVPDVPRPTCSPATRQGGLQPEVRRLSRVDRACGRLRRLPYAEGLRTAALELYESQNRALRGAVGTGDHCWRTERTWSGFTPVKT